MTGRPQPQRRETDDWAAAPETADEPSLSASRLDELRDAVGTEVVWALLTAFRDTNSDRLARLRIVADADPGEAGRIAHDLQGSAASLGAERLATLGRELRQATRVGDDDEIGALVGRTINELERMDRRLRDAVKDLDDGGDDPVELGPAELVGRVVPRPSMVEQRFDGHELADVPEPFRVLLVDDAADVRMLGQAVLGAAGCSVEVAATGREALDRVGDGEPPDVVVLDVQMPEMNGWVTLAALRAKAETAPLAVVLCTVDERPEDHLRACQLGADGYLPKPYSAGDLVFVVTEVAHRSVEERLRIRASRVRMASRRMDSAEKGVPR